MSVNATQTQISWIIETTNKKHKKPVILTLDGNQRYQLMMADVLSASFYHMIPSSRGIEITYDPFFANDRNCMRMIMDVLQVDEYIHVGIAHDRYQHFEFIKKAADSLGFGIIYVEHNMPKPGFQLEEMKKQLGDALVIFRSKEAREAWGYSETDNCKVIPDFVGICNRERDASSDLWLTIHDHINMFRNPVWDEVRESPLKSKIELRGWNGCSGYETTEVEEATLFNRYKGYINFDHIDPLPLNLLRAASYGMPILSVYNPALERLFQDGESIIFIDRAEQIEAVIEMTSEKEFSNIADCGKKVVKDNFGRKEFRDNWLEAIKAVTYE